ncbi:MAG: SurA N-terminal domain-containing protein [Pseudomonadota bacterium]
MAKGKISNTLIWILLGLLVLALAGFSAGGFGVNVRSIGKVGDQEIPAPAYANALQQEINALSAQTRQQISFPQAVSLGIDGQVLQRVIAATALDFETTQMGLSVGDENVRREVLATPAFRGIDGSFDRVSYSEALRRSGLSEREYEEAIRRDTARALLVNGVTSGAAPSELYMDTLFDYIASRRNFSWFAVTAEGLETEPSTPDDATLQAYHSENPELFSLPERKKLNVAWVTPDMRFDEVTVDEETLRALYEERSNIYQRPARRLVERLVFQTVEEADAAAARLNAEEITFEELVEERGLALEDINMGTVTESDLTAGAEVFALEEPGTTGVLPSSLGPAIFRVNAILVASTTSFEDAQEALGAEIRQDRAARDIEARAADYDDLLAGGATLEEISDDGFFKYEVIEWFPGSEAEIARYSAFQAAAAQIQEGDFAEIVQLDDGGLFAIEFVETLPETVQPYDVIQDEVLSAYLAAEEAEAVQTEATTLAEAWRNGEPPRSAGYELTNEIDILRSDSVPGTPPVLIAAVFEMEPEEVRVIENAGSSIVVRLTARLGPDPDDETLGAVRDQLAQGAERGMAEDMLALFSAAVQSEARIQLDQGAINAIHQSFTNPHGGGY